MQTIKAIILSMTVFFSSNAFAVSTATVTVDSDEMGHVMTNVAERAEADVQIRRIKNLLLTQEVDGEAAFEELEKLQKSLRGQK
jgi:dUTPase